jgi:hypothetical protein
MAKRVQFRRGTTLQHSVFIGAPGEITVDTEKNIIVVHDGVTPGGWPANRLSDVAGNINLQGVATFSNATPSSATTNGAIVVTGGVGVGGRITANNIAITATTASTSTTTGALTVAGGVGVAGRLTVTDLVETSSVTLKENINPLQNALDYILQLEGVIYDRKDGSSKDEAGFIAEQVNKILPSLVTKDENGKIHGLKYTKLIAYLVESIKDQQSQIEELKKRI